MIDSSHARDFPSESQTTSPPNRPTSRELTLAARRERSLMQGAMIANLARKVSQAFGSRRKHVA
jgi:hypothetical protein